jgi:hypothetical protein
MKARTGRTALSRYEDDLVPPEKWKTLVRRGV